MKAPKTARRERGTLIIALMAGIAIVMILSTVAVQNWADVVRRDNEAEMMFRAQDIVRALKRFQADKGRLPAELKELMEPGQKNQYFLRRLWKDPLVKGGQWQLLYASPGGGLFDPTVQDTPPGGAPQGGIGGTGGAGGIGGAGGAGGIGLGASGAGAFPPMNNGKDNPVGQEGHGGGATDPTGFPIAGVKSRCKERPFRKYKEKTEYADWIFSIFDMDQRQPQTGATGQPNPTPTFPPQSPPQQPPQQIPAPG